MTYPLVTSLLQAKSRINGGFVAGVEIEFPSIPQLRKELAESAFVYQQDNASMINRVPEGAYCYISTQLEIPKSGTLVAFSYQGRIAIGCLMKSLSGLFLQTESRVDNDLPVDGEHFLGVVALVVDYGLGGNSNNSLIEGNKSPVVKNPGNIREQAPVKTYLMANGKKVQD